MTFKALPKPSYFRGKRVILRTGYDVPLKKTALGTKVADPRRIESSKKSLDYLVSSGAKVIILSWLGRPGGVRDKGLSLKVVLPALRKIASAKVHFVNECVGEPVRRAIEKMSEGEVLLCENVRFEPGEEEQDPEFVKQLAALGDCVVFDAFPHAHRDVPSTTGIMKKLPSFAGFGMREEIAVLGDLIKKPKRPFITILGGAKISDKIPAIEQLAKYSDHVLIGGAMANHFMRAQGHNVGGSLLEKEKITYKKKELTVDALAEQFLKTYNTDFTRLSKQLVLPKIIIPHDFMAGNASFSPRGYEVNVEAGNVIADHDMFLDIGPHTIEYYKEILSCAKTVFWNGPLGYFENSVFETGTKAIAQLLAHSKAKVVIGGGDTEMVVSRYKLDHAFFHVSTGGGATLEFLGKGSLPVLKYL